MNCFIQYPSINSKCNRNRRFGIWVNSIHIRWLIQLWSASTCWMTMVSSCYSFRLLMKSWDDTFVEISNSKSDQAESDEFQIRMSFVSFVWLIMSSDQKRLSVYSPESQRALIYSLWNSKQSSTFVNSDRYCESLRMMKSAYQNKRRGQSSTLISLLHDNETSHVSKKTREVLNQLSINVIEHPPYSPDLSPCDVFLFGRLKMIRGRRFEDREVLENEVRRIFYREIQTGEYSKAMEDLIHRWQKCVSAQGD